MTSRLTLHPLKSSDAEEMFGVLQDPDIYHFIPDKLPTSVEMLRRRYAVLEQVDSPDGLDFWLNWIIRLTSTNAAIGYVQATVAKDTRVTSIGYAVHSSYWGQGLAREAVQHMMDILKTDYQVRTVNAEIDCRNRRSIKLLERLGFVVCGEAATVLSDGTAGKDILMNLNLDHSLSP